MSIGGRVVQGDWLKISSLFKESWVRTPPDAEKGKLWHSPSFCFCVNVDDPLGGPGPKTELCGLLLSQLDASHSYQTTLARSSLSFDVHMDQSRKETTRWVIVYL